MHISTDFARSVATAASYGYGRRMNRILPSDIRYGAAPAPDQTDVAEAAKVGKPQPNATQPDTGRPAQRDPLRRRQDSARRNALGTESAGTISRSDNAVAIVSDLIARGTMPRIDTTPLLTHKNLPIRSAWLG